MSVERITAHLYMVRSVPYPLHAAQVAAYVNGGQVKGWIASMLTTDMPQRSPRGTLDDAWSWAAEHVGRLAGQMMKERFHGVQRTAMGQGRCPHLGRVLCLGPPVPGSVWCALHPNGKKVIDGTPV